MAMNDELKKEYNAWLKRVGKTLANIRKSKPNPRSGGMPTGGPNPGHMTQSQAADLTGFDLKYYQDIEYGRRPITTRTLFQLCSGLKMEIHEFLGLVMSEDA